MEASAREMTRLLQAWSEGEQSAFELGFFGGLSVEETAEVLKVSPETVLRDWKLAKSWLRRELSEEKAVGA